MKVLITGASSGIGYSMAKYFSDLGYDLVLVARHIDNLKDKVDKFKTKVALVSMDLRDKDNCIELFNKYKDIDILVNNAGFGLFGEFKDTYLDREIEMINLNIVAVHTLCKLYLNEMIKRDSGRILNVASISGFLPGPLMSTYYATKNYVVRLSQAIKEELRRSNSNVVVSVLCPGPVKTNFDDVAGVNFSLKGDNSDYVAKYAVDKMFKGKFIIIPNIKIKLIRIGAKIVPDSLLARVVYKSQKRKR